MALRFNKILIANRGEIACRIARTARRLGIATVAVYSEADRYALHVEACDEAWCIGPAAASDSYLNAEKILQVAVDSGAQAVHPGYGFLSENAKFARDCERSGIVFIGPPVAAIETMGSKSDAKHLMQNAGVPLVPGYHGEDQGDAILVDQSNYIGFPQLIKASAGGGGKGMRVVNSAAEFKPALTSARREALASFGDDTVLIERYLTAPRHVELQVFADREGNVVHLFERDCSIQRRHQKVLEEAPAPGMSDALRAQMGQAAINCAQAIGYEGAGTVEFLLDTDERFYFMEMNTRLQVEHPVTEMITGLDLVEWQLDVAMGFPLPMTQAQIQLDGHAFEARIYAESPENDFLPSTGTLRYLRTPELETGVRIDTGVCEGDDISPHYDPMIAKLVVHGENRLMALRKLQRALQEYQIIGVQTNIGFLGSILSIPEFAGGDFDTGFIETHRRALFAAVNSDAQQATLLAGLYLLMARLTIADADYTRAASGDATSPWGKANAWRLNQVAKQVLLFGGAEGEYRIEAFAEGGQWRFALDGVEYLVGGRMLSEHTMLGEIDQQRFRLPVLDNGESITLWHQSRQWSFKRFNAEQAFSGAEAATGDLVAPMPGSIIALAVAEGDEVKAGDVLIVVEAMKMEHSIVAPMDAVVTQVFFAVGDQVEEGDHLIGLE